MMAPTDLVLAGGGVMLVAGLVRGFTGFGMGIIAVPFLSLLLPPADAVVVALILQTLVSFLNIRLSWRLCDWRLVSRLSAGALLATPLGSAALLYWPADVIRVCIAVIVAATALVLATGFRLRMVPSGRHVFGLGLVSGVMNGLAGMSGPPVVAFFLAAPLSVAVARASMIIFFMFSSVLALIPLAVFGKFHEWSLVAAAAGLPVVLLGSVLGTRFYRTSHEGQFRAISIGLLWFAALLAALRAFDGASLLGCVFYAGNGKIDDGARCVALSRVLCMARQKFPVGL